MQERGKRKGFGPLMYLTGKLTWTGNYLPVNLTGKGCL